MADVIGSDRRQHPLIATWLYLNITDLSAGASVKARPGTLHTVTINTKGAGSNVLTLYDALSATGTPVAVIDTTAAAVTLTYDLDFATGLYYVLATGTAADITVTYV